MENLYKNFIWMAAANITSSLFGLILFIYLGRTLAPQSIGLLSYSFTLIFFLANFVDLGLSTYGAREIAKDKSRISEYVSEIVSFRLLVAAVLAILLGVAVTLSCHLGLLRNLILGSLGILIVFSLATEWAYQGVEKMHMVFASLVTTSLLQLGIIYIFVKGSADLMRVPILYFIATLPMIMIFLIRLKFTFRIKKIDLERINKYLASSLVIWSIYLFVQVYNSLDIFIIGWFRGTEEVGYFTIARRITGGAALLMVFLANAALPRLSYTFADNMPQFRAATNRFLKLAVIFTVIVLVPIIFFGNKVIEITVGVKYLPAALPLKIMAIGLLFVLFNLPFSTGLIACGMEKKVLSQAAASAAVSVGSNFLLVPRYGMAGAAMSFVLAEALALSWILYIYEKRIRIHNQ